MSNFEKSFQQFYDEHERNYQSGKNALGVFNYTKEIEKAMQKCEEEVARIAHEKEAHEKVEASEKYSYGWFSAMLQLEAMANGDDNARSREVSICFSAVDNCLT